MNEMTDKIYALQLISTLRSLVPILFKGKPMVTGIVEYNLGVLEEHIEIFREKN